MASSISCSIQLTINSSHTSNPTTPNLNLRNGFLRIPRNLSGFGSGSGSGFMSTRLLGPSCGSRVKCWFKFGKNGVDAEGAGIYGSQSRDEFDRDDVEQVTSYPRERHRAVVEDCPYPSMVQLLPYQNDVYALKTVAYYFNYSGMLATEGTYDKMNALLSSDIHPVDILLLMAASEGDKPKIEELLRAGATYDVKDPDGKTALDRADDEIRDFILNFRAQKA